MNESPADLQVNEPPTRIRYRVLWLLFFLAVITYLDRLCISAAAPAIMQEFKFTPEQMGYIFSSFALAYALFEVPSGWLGDRFGTRRALTRIVFGWSVFTVLTGAATGFLTLLIVRFLFGAGEAGAFPNITRTISRWLPRSEQGKGISVSFLGLAIGSAIAAPLVFRLVEWQGWRMAFVIVALPGFIWCVIWARWFRDQPEDHPGVNKAEVQLIRSCDEATRTDESAEESLAEHSHHVPWRLLLTNSNLALICAMYFAYGYGIYFYVTWLPTYLIQARGFSSAYAQLFSSLPWIVSAGAFLFGGWLTDKLARRSLKLARCGVGATGYAISALALVAVANTDNRIIAALLIVVAASFQMMTVSAAWAVCLDVGRKNAGVVSGFMNMIGNLGGTLTPMVIGWSVQRLHSWTLPFYVAAGVFAFGVVMWLLVDPEKTIVSRPSSVVR